MQLEMFASAQTFPSQRRRLGGKAFIDYGLWLAPLRARELHDALVQKLTWEQKPITVFGKAVLQPRLIAWAGTCPYRYSGQTLEPKSPGAVLEELLDAVQHATGLSFNHILLNRYRNGQDHMGMHADDEPELGENPQIAALSLGVARRFVLEPKPKKLRHRKLSLTLEPGSLLVMGGRIQHAWRHGVPKQLGVLEERINVTFRQVKYRPGEAPPKATW